MAQGYARATGKPGILLVTSGPGATNCVTPLQDALMDGTPMIVFTAQVSTNCCLRRLVSNGRCRWYHQTMHQMEW